MDSPTLLERVVILAVALLVATVVVVVALVGIGLLGLTGIGTAALALGLLITIAFIVGIGLAVALGAGLVTFGLLAVGLFFLVLAAGASTGVGIVAVIAFLILASLMLALGPGPVTISLSVFSGLLVALFLLPWLALLLHLIVLSVALLATSFLGLVALSIFYAWFLFRMHRLPLRLLGLGGLTNMPAIPFRIFPDLLDTLIRLLDREQQRQPSQDAMTTVFTVGAETADARTFLFGSAEDRSHSLDNPDQFAMGWTALERMDRRAAARLPKFRAMLTDADKATTEFWPSFASYFGVFGVIPLQKVTDQDAARFRSELGVHWTTDMDRLQRSHVLYVIDMTIFGKMTAPTMETPRFTPATLTLLAQDSFDKTFAPILIRVSNGVTTHVYTNQISTDPNATAVTRSTWLYALEAAKTSITVWGIWLGHVHRYHMSTAAMQMTMAQRLPLLHPVRQVLGRQSQYLIPFDVVLLLIWNIITFPPPTSMNTSIQFLHLINEFAVGRKFFDDEPQATLDALGLEVMDFTEGKISMSEIINLPNLAAKLNNPSNPPDLILRNELSPAGLSLLTSFDGSSDPRLQEALVNAMNGLIMAAAPMSDFGFPPSTRTTAFLATLSTPPEPRDLILLNRMLMEDAFPGMLKSMSWNKYPVARYLLDMFDISNRYATAVVNAIYPGTPILGDLKVSTDAPLQQWMAASQDPTQGNIAGLSLPLDSRAKLITVLTSLIYRITAHGIGRINPVANPVLTYVANFPPCMEDSRIPDPNDPNEDADVPNVTGGPHHPTPLSTEQLLAFLPKTGTIGEMFSFISAFIYTDPYKPLIPLNWTSDSTTDNVVPGSNLTGGPDKEIHPFRGTAVDACEPALQMFRSEMQDFIRFFVADSNDQNNNDPDFPAHMNFQPTPAQIHQWELNIEL